MPPQGRIHVSALTISVPLWRGNRCSNCCTGLLEGAGLPLKRGTLANFQTVQDLHKKYLTEKMFRENVTCFKITGWHLAGRPRSSLIAPFVNTLPRVIPIASSPVGADPCVRPDKFFSVPLRHNLSPRFLTNHQP